METFQAKAKRKKTVTPPISKFVSGLAGFLVDRLVEGVVVNVWLHWTTKV